MSNPAPSGQFAATIADLRAGMDDARHVVHEIRNGIDSVLQQLSPSMPVDGIRGEVDELFRRFDEAIRQIGEPLARPGNPDALRAAGAAWANDIGGTASRFAASATLNGMQVDDYWTGVAADAYRNTLLPQNAALTALKTGGDEIDTALNDLADAIIVFWIAIITAFVLMAVALIGTLWSLGTVVGTPAAVGVAVGFAAALTTLITAEIVALANLANASAKLTAAVERRLSNDTTFPAGAWPRSVTPISADGSISDGDDTDWHLE